jgi:hypothetical protein
VPKDPLAYKFTGAVNEDGTAAEFIHGLPSRDIHRSEFEGMPDEAKAALKASPLHRAYGDADKQAAKAERRVEREAAEAAPAPVSTAPAPAEGKK